VAVDVPDTRRFRLILDANQNRLPALQGGDERRAATEALMADPVGMLDWDASVTLDGDEFTLARGQLRPGDWCLASFGKSVVYVEAARWPRQPWR
jgi:hypothetical protein